MPGYTQSPSVRSLERPCNGSTGSLHLVLPACFTKWPGGLDETVSELDLQNLGEYLENDLSLEKFDAMHRYLWLGSEWYFIETLDRQVRLYESIVITEATEQHLVYQDRCLYIKPLPEYLLYHSMWESYICKDDKLYASALGFLRSYYYPVRSKSDLMIAHRESLLPTEITWQQWTTFTRTAFPLCARQSCHDRYRHGVLGARRLTWIVRLCPETRSFVGFQGQWISGIWSPSGYIHDSTKWLLGALVYITIALTAMQVGLATDRLHRDNIFQKVSAGFTAFAILTPLAAICTVLGMASFTYVYQMWSHIQQRPTRGNVTFN